MAGGVERVLRMPPGCSGDIRAHAEAGYPHEVCGILSGDAAGGAVRVRRVLRARNLNTERARDRYEMDPAAQVEADRAARAEGLEIVGFYHSHPDHPPRPSPTDAAHAWPGYVYVICRVTKEGMRELRAWVFAERGGEAAEVQVEERGV